MLKYVLILFTLFPSLGFSQVPAWHNEEELLLSLQPDVSELTKLNNSYFKTLGKAVQGSDAQTSLSLACIHINYPNDPNVSVMGELSKTECNAFQVIYIKDSVAYALSLPISSELSPDSPLFLRHAAYRLFHEFLPSQNTKMMDKVTEATFNQNGWNWSETPERISNLEFLKAVHHIHRMLEPNRMIQSYPQNTSFPWVNWRLWADPRYLNQMTLFL